MRLRGAIKPHGQEQFQEPPGPQTPHLATKPPLPYLPNDEDNLCFGEI